MAPIAFTVPDAASESLLLFIATYGSVPEELKTQITDGATVEFIDDEGQSIEGINAAVRFIAGKSPSSSGQLLGETKEDQAKIAEWLTFSQTELNPLLDDNLMKLNSWLESRTFFIGCNVTLADLVIYATVSPAVIGFPIAEHGHFCNLIRWYDHIHAIADPTSLFPAVKFQKPRLIIPPPVAPVVDNSAGKAKVKGDDTKNAEPKNSNELSSTTTTTTTKEKKIKAGKEPASSNTPAPPQTPSNSSASTPPATKAATTATAGKTPTVDALDIRVGVITKIGPHPNAESLYLEEIDLGEDAPRQVISGLRKFVTEENMLNRRVVVVCNLKPAKMRDIMSYGMVLCASSDDHTVVDPIIPPKDAAIGEKVMFEGYTAEPESQIHPKKKIFEKIAPDLVVDQGGVCTYKGVAFMTSKGPVTATLHGAHIA